MCSTGISLGHATSNAVDASDISSSRLVSTYSPPLRLIPLCAACVSDSEYLYFICRLLVLRIKCWLKKSGRPSACFLSSPIVPVENKLYPPNLLPLPELILKNQLGVALVAEISQFEVWNYFGIDWRISIVMGSIGLVWLLSVVSLNKITLPFLPFFLGPLGIFQPGWGWVRSLYEFVMLVLVVVVLV